MDEVAKLLNNMMESGIISNYAVFGAIAQMRYTAAVATLDADILVAVPDPERLDVLSPIYKFCKRSGYHPEGEAVRVGPWPVQFIPAFDALTLEAMQNAEVGDIDGSPLRVVGAVYLAVIALATARAKDYARILALLENSTVPAAAIEGLAAKHNLSEAWSRFKLRFLDD